MGRKRTAPAPRPPATGSAQAVAPAVVNGARNMPIAAPELPVVSAYRPSALMLMSSVASRPAGSLICSTVDVAVNGAAIE